MNLTRTKDAESEVLSLNEVKSQLRITTTADDESLCLFISGVRQRAETFLGKTLVTSTWEYKTDCFKPEMLLPMGPLQSITSIDYIDTAGASQTFSDFQFDKSGRLKPAYDFDWPDTRDQYDAVTVTYVAGEIHAGHIPEDIKHAMLLMIGAADVGREDVVIGAGVLAFQLPDSAIKILTPHRRWNL